MKDCVLWSWTKNAIMVGMKWGVVRGGGWGVNCGVRGRWIEECIVEGVSRRALREGVNCVCKLCDCCVWCRTSFWQS